MQQRAFAQNVEQQLKANTARLNLVQRHHELGLDLTESHFKEVRSMVFYGTLFRLYIQAV